MTGSMMVLKYVSGKMVHLYALIIGTEMSFPNISYHHIFYDISLMAIFSFAATRQYSEGSPSPEVTIQALHVSYFEIN